MEHPAAKIIILASQMQEQEIGDGTNFIIILAGALLQEAEDLLRMVFTSNFVNLFEITIFTKLDIYFLQGLTPTEIALGYELAAEKALEILPSLTCYEVKDFRNKDEVVKGIQTAVMSKQYGNEGLLSNLIADACSKLYYRSLFCVNLQIR